MHASVTEYVPTMAADATINLVGWLQTWPQRAESLARRPRGSGRRFSPEPTEHGWDSHAQCREHRKTEQDVHAKSLEQIPLGDCSGDLHCAKRSPAKGLQVCRPCWVRLGALGDRGVDHDVWDGKIYVREQ